MCRVAAVEQVQVRQHVGGRSLLDQRVLTLAARRGKEAPELLFGDIGKVRARAGRGVERPGSQAARAFQLIDQAGVNGGHQLGCAGNPATNELPAGALDQLLHLRVPGSGLVLYRVDQSHLVEPGRLVELPLRRRYARGTLPTVAAGEEPKVDVGPAHLGEVDLVRPLVAGRQLLEEEDVEEAPQQGVVANEIGQRTAFGRQLLLHAAHEDAQPRRWQRGGHWSVSPGSEGRAGSSSGQESAVRRSWTGERSAKGPSSTVGICFMARLVSSSFPVLSCSQGAPPPETLVDRYDVNGRADLAERGTPGTRTRPGAVAGSARRSVGGGYMSPPAGPALRAPCRL